MAARRGRVVGFVGSKLMLLGELLAQALLGDDLRVDLILAGRLGDACHKLCRSLW